MRSRFFALLVVMTLCQCQTVVDKVATFEISGIVHDHRGAPLGGVEIYFVDTGLDAHLRSTKLLGSTTHDGRFEHRFRHGWARLERGLSEPSGKSKGEFNLRFVSREVTREVRYELQALPRIDKAYRVTFDVKVETR